MLSKSERHFLGAVCFLLGSSSFLSGSENDPFALDGRITIDVQIEGKPAKLLLDTGASSTALFESRAKWLGLVPERTQKVSIAGNEVEIGVTKPVRFSMFKAEAEVPLNLIPFRPVAECDGVLSWRHIGVGPLYLDVRGRRVKTMKVMPSKGWRHWKLDAGSDQLFFEVTGGEKQLGRVFVDTGATFGLRVSPAIWDAWRKENPDAATTFETFRYPVGDPYVHEIAWVEEFRLGDLVLRNVDIGPIPGAGERKAVDAGGKEFIATLGIGALENLRLIVNRGGGEVLTQSLSPFPNHNRLGAVFEFVLNEDASGEEEGGVFVARVLPNSPADRAGMMTGDVLLKINEIEFGRGVRASKNPEPIFKSPPGIRLRIEIEREGERKELLAELQDLIP